MNFKKKYPKILIFIAALALFSVSSAANGHTPHTGASTSDICPGIEGNQTLNLPPNETTVTINGENVEITGGLVPCDRNCDDPLTQNFDESAHCAFCHFFYLLQKIIDWIMLTVAPLIATLLIVFGGFLLLASRGNPGQTATGKRVIIWTLLGYAVILIAWVLVNTFLTGLGLEEWTGINAWWELTCPL